MIPRYKGRYVKWTSEDYDLIYSSTEECDTTKVDDPMPRKEFLEHVKEHHTAASNLNEELVAKTIDFVGDDLKRKEHIAATVADNFTKEEIKKMTAQSDVKVIHGEKVVKYEYADGAHLDRTVNEPTEIQLDDAADENAITHEFVHALRSEDKDRKGIARTVYAQDKEGYVIGASKLPSLMFAEECAVIAETEIRTKYPTKRPNSKFSELSSKDVSYTQKRRIYLSERRK